MKKFLVSAFAILALSLPFTPAIPAYAAESALPGDVNSDGAITVEDSQAVSNYLSGNDSILNDLSEEERLTVADVTGDGNINFADVITIKRNISNLPNFMDIPYSVKEKEASVDETQLIKDFFYELKDSPYEIQAVKTATANASADSSAYDGKIILRNTTYDSFKAGSRYATLVAWSSEDPSGTIVIPADSSEADVPVYTEYKGSSLIIKTKPESAVKYDRFAIVVMRNLDVDQPERVVAEPLDETGLKLEAGSRPFYQYGEVRFPRYGEYLDVTAYFEDGSRMDVDTDYLGTPSPEEVPAWEGEFTVSIPCSTPQGSMTAEIQAEAYITDAVIDVDRFRSQIPYSLLAKNGKEYEKLVFTDQGLPSDAEVIEEYALGGHIYASRLAGQEDTLYVASRIPGQKLIIPSGSASLYVPMNTRDIDARGLDTGNVTSLDGIFWHKGNYHIMHYLRSLNFSGCDFSSVVETGQPWNGFLFLESVDFSNCDFSNTEKMSMFCGAKGLKEVNLEGIIVDPSKLKSTEFMFNEAGSATNEPLNLHLYNLDTSGVENASFMFNGMKDGEEIDLSANNWDSLTEETKGMLGTKLYTSNVMKVYCFEKQKEKLDSILAYYYPDQIEFQFISFS